MCNEDFHSGLNDKSINLSPLLRVVCLKYLKIQQAFDLSFSSGFRQYKCSLKCKNVSCFHHSWCDFYLSYLSKTDGRHIQQVRRLKADWKIQGSHPMCSVCLDVYPDVWKQIKELEVGFVWHRIGSFLLSRIFHLVALTLANLIISLQIASKAGKHIM